MQLQRLVTHFTYRIEPNPDGGFIARATDPTTPPLEAASREELLQKIQAKIAANLASEFPGLKLLSLGKELKGAFHIERTPTGGFALHSADSNAPPIETDTHEGIEGHFAEKLIALLGKDITPELQALANQGKAGDIEISVKRKTWSTWSLSNRGSLPPGGSIQPDEAKIENASLRGTIGNSPITPESRRSWIILILPAVAALIYFFLYHR
jgi:hypothetical protein